MPAMAPPIKGVKDGYTFLEMKTKCNKKYRMRRRCPQDKCSLLEVQSKFRNLIVHTIIYLISSSVNEFGVGMSFTYSNLKNLSLSHFSNTRLAQTIPNSNATLRRHITDHALTVDSLLYPVRSLASPENSLLEQIHQELQGSN
jgi:hypothetical protein